MLLTAATGGPSVSGPSVAVSFAVSGFVSALGSDLAVSVLSGVEVLDFEPDFWLDFVEALLDLVPVEPDFWLELDLDLEVAPVDCPDFLAGVSAWREPTKATSKRVKKFFILRV